MKGQLMKDPIRTASLAALALLMTAFHRNAVAEVVEHPFLGEPFFELREDPCPDLATITVATDGSVLLLST
jgi:hypothetical protein